MTSWIALLVYHDYDLQQIYRSKHFKHSNSCSWTHIEEGWHWQEHVSHRPFCAWVYRNKWGAPRDERFKLRVLLRWYIAPTTLTTCWAYSENLSLRSVSRATWFWRRQGYRSNARLTWCDQWNSRGGKSAFPCRVPTVPTPLGCRLPIKYFQLRKVEWELLSRLADKVPSGQLSAR